VHRCDQIVYPLALRRHSNEYLAFIAPGSGSDNVAVFFEFGEVIRGIRTGVSNITATGFFALYIIQD
jgi:hypothetical protein